MPWAVGPSFWDTEPDGLYDHPPEPTEANLSTFSPIVPAVDGSIVGFAQDPDADRLAIMDENGRYIRRSVRWRGGPKPARQEAGAVVLNLSST